LGRYQVVTTWMGDCTGRSSWYITNTKVNDDEEDTSYNRCLGRFQVFRRYTEFDFLAF